MMIPIYEEMIFNSNPPTATYMQNGFLVSLFNNKTPCILYNFGDKKTNLKNRLKMNEITLESQQFRPCYRLVESNEYMDMEYMLQQLGYRKTEQGFVVGLEIKDLQKELFTFADHYKEGVFIDDYYSDEWFDDYCYLRDLKPAFAKLVGANIENSKLQRYYFTLVEEGKMIGMAYAVVDRGMLTLVDIILNPRFRRLKYGRKLTLGILSYALKNKIDKVIVEVNSENEAAVRLFRSIGFSLEYRYWNREK